jgi:hypothetical protein
MAKRGCCKRRTSRQCAADPDPGELRRRPDPASSGPNAKPLLPPAPGVPCFDGRAFDPRGVQRHGWPEMSGRVFGGVGSRSAMTRADRPCSGVAVPQFGGADGGSKPLETLVFWPNVLVFLASFVLFH